MEDKNARKELKKETLESIDRVIDAELHGHPSRGLRGGELFRLLDVPSKEDLGNVTELCRSIKADKERLDIDSITVRMPYIDGDEVSHRIVDVFFSIKEL